MGLNSVRFETFLLLRQVRGRDVLVASSVYQGQVEGSEPSEPLAGPELLGHQFGPKNEVFCMHGSVRDPTGRSRNALRKAEDRSD